MGLGPELKEVICVNILLLVYREKYQITGWSILIKIILCNYITMVF